MAAALRFVSTPKVLTCVSVARDIMPRTLSHSTVKTSTSALRTMGREIVTTPAQTLRGHSAVRVPRAST
ncbi:hypothetical protein OS493_040643 [Desmophyllum pertusum]|uniref:Uncharacterized protein n=1 Tax=Desmophyllum pertusum TaxID=174260 RepID=A0A9X0CDK2_9CNID|nr:hypothetical protein OS493_040643 [Desmophyllum pertusum]